MPVILRKKGYRFYFYSNESEEPMHVHVEKAEANGKIWLEPKMEDEYFYGFTAREVREMKELVVENLEILKKAWNEYFKEKKSKRSI